MVVTNMKYAPPLPSHNQLLDTGSDYWISTTWPCEASAQGPAVKAIFQNPPKLEKLIGKNISQILLWWEPIDFCVVEEPHEKASLRADLTDS